MADLDHVAPGDPLVIPARTWNMVIDAARFHRDNQKGRFGAGPNAFTPLVPAVEVYVRNTTGGTLLEWSVVVPTGYAIEPEDAPLNVRRTPVFDVSAPISETDLILLTVAPIADGKIGRAVVAGAAVAVVEVTDPAHRFAKPVVGNLFQLTSADCGPARLAVPATEGTEKRVVVLGGPPCDMPTGTAGDCQSGCGSLVSLATTATLKLELVCATGSFAGIDTEQFEGLYAVGAAGVWTFQEWVDGSPGSWQNKTLNWLGSTGTAVFTWNGTPLPTLTLGGTTLTLRCLDADGTFSAGPRNGINGDGGYTPATDCESNELVLRVRCSCARVDGYEGPGYYCVADASCEGDKTCVLLDDDSICTFAGVICDGPYDTLGECEATCDPAQGCLGAPVPSPLTATMTVTGGGACTTDDGMNWQMTATAGDVPYTGTAPGSGGDMAVTVDCSGDVWTFSHTGTVTCQFRDAALNANQLDFDSIVSLSPFHIRFTGQYGGALCGDCGNTYVDVQVDIIES